MSQMQKIKLLVAECPEVVIYRNEQLWNLELKLYDHVLEHRDIQTVVHDSDLTGRRMLPKEKLFKIKRPKTSLQLLLQSSKVAVSSCLYTVEAKEIKI